MLSRLLALVAVTFLAACGADHKWASDAEVASARYVQGPPASITLYTSINGRSGSGAHSGLLINGSERVLYDPAGSWELTGGFAPERYDLHYGMTQPVLDTYLQFQSEGPFHVIEQTIIVSQAVADQAIAAAIAQGAAPKADCSHSISTILHKVPGFEALDGTFFPKALSRSFGKLPGVTERTIDLSPDGAQATTN